PGGAPGAPARAGRRCAARRRDLFREGAEALDNFYYENKKCRIMVEHDHFPTEELYLTMCGVESCLAGQGFGPVDREGYHLHVILSGRGSLRVGEEEIELRAGQMFCEKPGEITEYRASVDEPWTYCWMTFGGIQAKWMAEAAGFTEGVNTLDCNVDPLRFYRVAESVLTHQELTVSAALRRFGLLYEFVALAIESAAATPGERDRRYYLPRSGPEYIRYARDFIRHNYADISVTDIAEYLGISRSHLTRLFKTGIGCSPSEYLMHIRMERGAWLLANTPMSIQEISASIGYEDQLTFSKAFKKLFDVSPKYYRALPLEQRKELKDIVKKTDHIGEADT
ncbi:MAG: AraC family transcriptional regulator, partial [Clostridia bacterium]|nr:AraC family transcriptional regulator [Clostridia bacterium]